MYQKATDYICTCLSKKNKLRYKNRTIVKQYLMLKKMTNWLKQNFNYPPKKIIYQFALKESSTAVIVKGSITCIFTLMTPWQKVECRVKLIGKHFKHIQNTCISNVKTLIKYVGVIYWELNKRILKEMLILSTIR